MCYNFISKFHDREGIFMKSKNKQIAAIICIVLLILLYVATLVVSLLDFPAADRLFAACLGATMGLPILLWIYVAIYGKYTKKKTFADLFPEETDTGTDTDSASDSETK